MPYRFAIIALGCLIGAASAQAQDAGWASGYQMGQSWAGVANAQKGRLTFFCGDAAAARANQAIPGGPSLSIEMPTAAGLGAVKAVEIVVDGRATRVPVSPEAGAGSVAFSWKPGPGFDARRMRVVVESLRKARTIEVRAAGQSAVFPTQGAAKALADDPLRCG